MDNQRNEKARIAKENYEQNKKFCLHCTNEISYERRANSFCSQSCSATFNNLKREKKIINCLFCGKQTHARNKYCSFECQHDHKRAEAINNKTAGHSAAKNYLIKLHGAKCMECGWDKINPHTNRVPIELEHIDGNSENNELSNLKLLCPNCHSLTPTYKALNKGNGRHKRMTRYKEGKSY
jgi:predicted nucleic acid-binding Zn ribbon protein